MLLKRSDRKIAVIFLIISTILIQVSFLYSNKTNFILKNSSSEHIEFDFELGQWKFDTVYDKNTPYQKVVSDSKDYLYIDEEETLPIFSTMLAIPAGMDVELVTDNVFTSRVRTDNLLNKDLINSSKSYESLYPERKIVVSEPGQFRDLRVVNINVFPFQYDSKNNQLEVLEKASIALRLIPSRNSDEFVAQGPVTPGFHNIYSSIILNYNSNRDEVFQTQSRILIIYANFADASYTNAINGFANWKRQKGFLVDLASTAAEEAGSTTTSVKTYITNRYNNENTRPDFVILIGDASGTFTVPYFSSDYGDYPYQLLVGADQYPEVMLGRISINSVENLLNYFARVYQYERDINPANATWLNNMLLVGDSASSGISTYYTSNYIQEISSLVNPNYNYTKYLGSYGSGSGIASNFNSAINSGVGFFNYRGYLGMSGWSPTDNLINTNKLNHGVFITCATSTFYSGTFATESYLRLGTTSVPNGGITASGMATTATHTGFNNSLCGGIFDGIFNQGMRTMGEPHVFTRLYLLSVYGVSAPALTNSFLRYLNLMGDPTVEVFVSVPKTFQVTVPTPITTGTSNIEILVKDIANNPISNAIVNIFQDGTCNVTAFTNSQGKAFLTIPSNLTGNIIATVSKSDYKPNQSIIEVTGTGLVYNHFVIDDDTSGNSNGNNNQVINAGETIEYKVHLRNNSASSISNITGTFSCSDPYVTLHNSSMIFSAVNAGNTTTHISAIRFTVANDCLDNHPITFYMNGTSSAGAWNSVVQHYVRSADLDVLSYTVTGSNSYLEPGESTNIYITVQNYGSETAQSVTATISSLSPFVTISQPNQSFGNINSMQIYSNSSNPFTINASTLAIVGMKIPLQVTFTNTMGYSETEKFDLIIGNPGLNDPLGQDDYGYFIFGMEDTNSPFCPTYNWIGIAPAEGGSGTLLSISDPGASNDEGDQVSTTNFSGQLVNLPFTFKFYGVDYNQITVVSNGFIAMGVTNNFDFRNWRLPGPLGPNAMIAPFWDDLSTRTGGIYTYYNSSNHTFIIEWYNLRNGAQNTDYEETFQVILYDPMYYPTYTGDGPIKIQYKVFNNVDSSTSSTSHGCYSTIGIKDHTGLVGLEYTFNNVYPPTAQPLSSERSLYITTPQTFENEPCLNIGNTTYIDTNGNGQCEPGETIDIRMRLDNIGGLPATNVIATISENDPWISILSNAAAYGTINPGNSVTNSMGLIINVHPDAPNNHYAFVNVTITSSQGTYNRVFTVRIDKTIIELRNVTISDTNGNNNNVLDPGETAELIIQIHNIGNLNSSNGTISVYGNTDGVIITDPSQIVTHVPGNSFINVSWIISVDSSVQIGTLVPLNFDVSLGNINAQYNHTLDIGTPTEILIGAGASTQNHPLNRFYNYSVHEAIYLASEIVLAGSIKSIGYFKSSGANVDPIEAVTIYMKNTPLTSLSSGNYSTDGYTAVYSGSFSNNAVSGWMEVNLDTMFQYDGINNLAILIIKNYQQYVSSYPMWRYSTAVAYRVRQNQSDSSMPTSLTASYNLPNMRMLIFETPGILYPPQNIIAFSSHQSVHLSWNAPFSGTPIGYKVFRNGTLISSVTALSYVDIGLTNGVTYTYTIKAVYQQGESEFSLPVNSTPQIVAPTQLVAIGGLNLVNLSWQPITGSREESISSNRLLSGYNIYRNGILLSYVTGNNYIDNIVVNETTYNYYVTSVYTNPDGESSPSATVVATPTAFPVIGSGTLVTANSNISPINNTYKSIHYQSVYTQAELNAVGVYGPIYIRALGFNIVTAPNLALPNFVVRMKHTAAANSSAWVTADGLQTVYHNSSYMPVAGRYDMLYFSTPFLWNGVDNIVVDTAFGLISNWTQTGTIQYTTITNGSRATFSDTADQTDVFTGGTPYTRRPNIRIQVQGLSLETPEVNIECLENGVKLTWNPIQGAVRYLVLSSNQPDSGFTQHADTHNCEFIHITDENNRFYKIIATDSTRQESVFRD